MTLNDFTFYTPATKLGGGILESPCLSVRLSSALKMVSGA